jgi:hypothetical protein
VSDSPQIPKMEAYLTKHGWIGTSKCEGRILRYQLKNRVVYLYPGYCSPEFEISVRQGFQEGDTLAELVSILFSEEV